MTIKQKYFGIAGILAIAALFIAFFTYMIVYKSDEIFRTIPKIEQPKTPGIGGVPMRLPPEPEEDAEVYAYSGIIKKINYDLSMVIINTYRGEKRITFDGSTVVVQKDAPTREQRLFLSNIEIAAIMKNETPFTGRLSEGDSIIAESSTNIRGEYEFRTNKIIVIK